MGKGVFRGLKELRDSKDSREIRGILVPMVHRAFKV
jgi:hypothetical protein